MKDYSAMSDDEISKSVGNFLGVEWANLDDNYHNLCYWKSGAGPFVFDPCNDPADAWPIIVESKIANQPVHDGVEKWLASRPSDNDRELFTFSDKNPLRSAMIVFLMMKDEAVNTQGEIHEI